MKYGVVLADPPWEHVYYSTKPNSRKPKSHYDVQTADFIRGLDVVSVCEEDAVLLLWSTWPHLAIAVSCIDAWGFEYKTGLPWLKLSKDMLPRMGCGYHARACSELLLIATRGKPKAPEPFERQEGVLFSGLGKHSEKPLTIYDRAELYDGPYIELFARPLGSLIETLHPHWRRVGNEVDGLDMVEALERIAYE